MVSVNVLFILLAVETIQNVESKWALPPETYCCIRCGLEHVLCEFQSDELSNNCYGGKVRHLTKIQIDRFVERHNYYRNNLARQFKIANMMVLKWDPILALIAQRWANQCILSEAKCVDTIYYQAVNVVYDETNYRTFAETLEGYASSLFLPRENVSIQEEINFSNSRWAGLTHLGCGFVTYFQGNSNVLHLSCNYGPAPSPNYDPYEHTLMGDEWCPKCGLENYHECRDKIYVYLCNDSYKDFPVLSIVLCFIWILT